MNKEEATAFVIKELGQHHSRNEIVRVLCEQAGIPWADAEQFVRQVEAGHGREINARQSPIVIILGIIGVVGGIVLIVYGIQFFANFAGLDAVDMALNSRLAYYRIGSLITGVGMLTGGIAGLWQTISGLFKDDE